MSDEAVSSGSWYDVGADWVRALESQHLDRAVLHCQPGVRSRILTPRRFDTLESADALVAKLRQWFGDADVIQIQQLQIGPVGEKLGISYRMLVHEQDEWFEVEQQVYGTLKDGSFEHLDLLCSGFQPAPIPDHATGGNSVQESPRPASVLPSADQSLVMGDEEGQGASCAILTPAIKAKLREMDSGQVLRVQVHDPSARGDVEAWSRLSGNELLKTVEHEDGRLSFFLRKK